MRLTQVLAISLLVVLLSSGIESFRLHKRDAAEDEGILSTVQGYVNSAFSSISFAAEGLYDKVKQTGVPDKVQEIYDQAAEKISIYAGVLSDQVYHWSGSD
ncbi:PREDICTED: apolipoprotein C-II [Nanorana parkeri]|uniref:apolipoprotein C-II n=1 Tax=Nanorana parkeri TaxID=125878 RepID=UPI000854A098|nr:PREDICTED: apolipoprotein C-II [Nanorana parkeri]